MRQGLHLYDLADSYSDEERVCGFSASQCEELASYNVWPWDDEADRVMVTMEEGFY